MASIHSSSTGHERHPGHVQAPTDVLRDEHLVIMRALTVGEALARAVTERGTALDRTRLRRLVAFLRGFADRCHHGKEEQHLFPAMAKAGVPVEGGPLGVMLEEHVEGRALIAAMESSDDAGAAAALQRYAHLLRAHIDKENSVLFAIAETVLSEAEQRRLAAAFEAIEEEAIGPGGHDQLVRELEGLEAQGS